MPVPKTQKSRAELICIAMRSAILERALLPGMKLPEDSLGERFGASRTIIRQALEKLAAEGLVELRPNRGAAVAQPSLEEARDLFELRAQIEDLVIARLASGLTAAQEEALVAHIAREEAAQSGPSPISIRLATEFHILMAALTESPVLIRYVNEISYRCGFTLSQFSRPHSTHCGIQEHRDIVAALKSGDVLRAQKIAREHLDQVAARAQFNGAEFNSFSHLEALEPYASPVRQNG
ncbi:GntR family transcriptional regulator [Thalassococcus profundi]|uniref:GntR family transcriptional regulator n=1 Tax=Thalassococcus profundi TaxID=2282382 RepID=A0A369TRU4_9RHOB|nr:GntR family transcriptional regulator [Thalassococcus profundi]RDD67998.1 GntR family transcriptional regulator [Thalassococcus profundi]